MVELTVHFIVLLKCVSKVLRLILNLLCWHIYAWPGVRNYVIFAPSFFFRSRILSSRATLSESLEQAHLLYGYVPLKTG